MRLDTEAAASLYSNINNEYKYFAPDNAEAYGQFLEIYKTCSHFAQHHYTYYGRDAHSNYALNNNSAFQASQNAYKLLTLFGQSSVEGTLKTYDTFLAAHEDSIVDEQRTHIPVETRTLFFTTLPHCLDYAKPHYNLSGWKEKFIEFGMDSIKNANHLSRIEQHLSRIPTSVKEFQEYLPVALYRRYDENPKLAKLAHIYEIDETEFNYILEIQSNSVMHYPQHESLPEITFNMTEEIAKIRDAEVEDDIDGEFTAPSESGSIDPSAEHIYFVKLPESDIRHDLFKSGYDDVPGAPQSIYVLINIGSGSSFNPRNINWDNLEQDGYEIMQAYKAYIGTNGQLFIEQCYFGSLQELDYNIRNCYEEIIGEKFLELFPDLEAILDTHRGLSGAMYYHPFHQKDEMSAKYSELHMFDRANDRMKFDYDVKSLPFQNVKQIENIIALDNSLPPQQHICCAFSPFVIGGCSEVQEMLDLYNELLALKNSNPERYKFIEKSINNFDVGVQIPYERLKTLPDETLEFLASLKMVPTYIPLREMLDAAISPTEFKRAFLTLFFSKMSDDEESVALKFAQLDDDVINKIAASKIFNNPALRLFNIWDFVDLEIETIKLLTSYFAAILHANGISYKSLVANPDILEVKKMLIISVIRAKIDTENYVHNMPINLEDVVGKCSEAQLDYIIYKDEYYPVIDLIKLLEFIEQNPNADRSEIEMRNLEIFYEGQTQEPIEAGTFAQLSDEKKAFLQKHRPHHYHDLFGDGICSVKFFISLSPELMKSMFRCPSIFTTRSITPEELAGLENPVRVFDLLMEDHGSNFIGEDIQILGVEGIEHLLKHYSHGEECKRLITHLKNGDLTIEQIKQVDELKHLHEAGRYHFNALITTTALKIYKTGFITFDKVLEWCSSPCALGHLEGLLGDEALLIAQNGYKVPVLNYPKIEVETTYMLDQDRNSTIKWVGTMKLIFRHKEYFSNDVLASISFDKLQVIARHADLLPKINLQDLAKLSVDQINQLSYWSKDYNSFEELLTAHNFVLEDAVVQEVPPLGDVH